MRFFVQHHEGVIDVDKDFSKRKTKNEIKDKSKLINNQYLAILIININKCFTLNLSVIRKKLTLYLIKD